MHGALALGRAFTMGCACQPGSMGRASVLLRLSAQMYQCPGQRLLQAYRQRAGEGGCDSRVGTELRDTKVGRHADPVGEQGLEE